MSWLNNTDTNIETLLYWNAYRYGFKWVCIYGYVGPSLSILVKISNACQKDISLTKIPTRNNNNKLKYREKSDIYFYIYLFSSYKYVHKMI